MFSRKLLGRRAFSSINKYTLPELPYEYSALEPVISGEIMELHHSKHHNTYVTNFNGAIEQLYEAQSKNDATKVAKLHGALKFNGGGHINHSIFWQNLAPTTLGGGQYDESMEVIKAINEHWGSVDAFITEFNTRTAAVQGSGWGWLGFNSSTKKLAIQEMANQDPLTLAGLEPLLGIDVWEHAYYLQYKNVRPNYLKEIWKVVNWQDVNQRYLNAKN